jgi:hypothetical protein
MVLQVSDNIISELTISGPSTEEEINNAERDQCPHQHEQLPGVERRHVAPSKHMRAWATKRFAN